MQGQNQKFQNKRVTSFHKGDTSESIEQKVFKEIDFTQHYTSSVIKSASNAYGWNVARLKQEQKKQTHWRLKLINPNTS